MTHVVIDSESSGFNPVADKIWVVCGMVLGTEPLAFHDKDSFCDWILDTRPELIIGHNLLGHDTLTLQRIWKIPFTVGRKSSILGREVKFVDTCLLSQFLNPDREGGHSLENFGSILGFPKMDFRKALIEAGVLKHADPKGAEFKQYHPIMDDYCKQDCRVNEKTYHYLMKEVERYDT